MNWLSQRDNSGLVVVCAGIGAGASQYGSRSVVGPSADRLALQRQVGTYGIKRGYSLARPRGAGEAQVILGSTIDDHRSLDVRWRRGLLVAASGR